MIRTYPWRLVLLAELGVTTSGKFKIVSANDGVGDGRRHGKWCNQIRNGLAKGRHDVLCGEEICVLWKKKKGCLPQNLFLWEWMQKYMQRFRFYVLLCILVVVDYSLLLQMRGWEYDGWFWCLVSNKERRRLHAVLYATLYALLVLASSSGFNPYVQVLAIKVCHCERRRRKNLSGVPANSSL